MESTKTATRRRCATKATPFSSLFRTEAFKQFIKQFIIRAVRTTFWTRHVRCARTLVNPASPRSAVVNTYRFGLPTKRRSICGLIYANRVEAPARASKQSSHSSLFWLFRVDDKEGADTRKHPRPARVQPRSLTDKQKATVVLSRVGIPLLRGELPMRSAAD